jgi:hypothetical protein
MKFELNSALIVTLLYASAHSQPVIPHITASLANDKTGFSAQATIPANGTVFTVPGLSANTNIDNSNVILVSNAELTSFVKKIICFFREVNRTIPVNNKQKFVFLDRNHPCALVDVSRLTFRREF